MEVHGHSARWPCVFSAAAAPPYQIQGTTLMTFNHWMAVKQPGLRGEISLVSLMCVSWIVLVAFFAWTIRAGAALSCWLCVLGEYWRDRDNNSYFDYDFIFAMHRISSGTNGLQDHQCFSGRKKRKQRR
jgi:hypothetical protein